MLPFVQYLQEFALSLKYHNKLNPAIWKKDKLSDDDRDVLLAKALHFVEFSGVPAANVTDVVFTGSNANFNWTKYSDVDLHIMADLEGLDQDLLYRKKVAWAHTHEDKLGKYPIEMYIQNEDDEWPKGQGVYSLVKNTWLVRPVHLGSVDILKEPNTQSKIEHEIKTIKSLLRSKTTEPILEYKNRLWKMRTAGLSSQGEFSIENIIYKDLRNKGWIARLNEKLKKLRHI